MKEYITDAIVLDKEPKGDLDQRVFLYTQDLGKIVAKVTSGRRIISKLSGHLEPLNIVKVRLIGNGGFQLADALKLAKLPVGRASLKIAKLIKASVLENHPDQHLWSVLKNGSELKKVLNILGFDYFYASCSLCNKAAPGYFLFKELAYFCEQCLPSGMDSEDYLEI